MKLFWANAIISAPDGALINHDIKQIRYRLNGLDVCESFYPDGQLFWREYREQPDNSLFLRHRDYNEGPALEIWYEDGSLRSRFFYHKASLHRPIEHGPAVIYYSESGKLFEEYWLHGEKVPDYEAELECKTFHEVEKLYDC